MMTSLHGILGSQSIPTDGAGLPGFTRLAINNGLFRYGVDNVISLGPGKWRSPNDQASFMVVTKYTFNHLSEIAFKAPTEGLYELGLGLMNAYTIAKERTAEVSLWADPEWGSGIYTQRAAQIDDVVNPPVLAPSEYIVVRMMNAPGSTAANKELLAFRTSDAVTYTPIPLPVRLNNLTAALNYVLFEFFIPGQVMDDVIGKGLTLQP